MRKTEILPTKLLVLVAMIVIVMTGCKKNDEEPSVIKDGDGNIYSSVKIGTQTWLVESLKTTKYSNGDPIALVTAEASWSALSTGAYSDFSNNTANATVYGHLYNWYAVKDSRKICPTGWHVPTNDEWSTLASSLGGEAVAGGKLKEAGTSHWASPNTQASNSSGFTALPAGYRYANGYFFDMYESVFFWTSSGNSVDNGYAWSLFYNDEATYEESNNDAKNGYSVRCIKD